MLHDSSRSSLKVDLMEHVRLNVANLADIKLKANTVSDDYIDNCYLATKPTIDESLAEIQNSSHTQFEQYHYGPWMNILQSIYKYSDVPLPGIGSVVPKRQFVKTAFHQPGVDDGIMHPKDGRKPDICLIDVPADTKDPIEPADVLWRHTAIVFEVKSRTDQGPYEVNQDGNASDGVKAVIREVGGFVRLQLAIRPFQIFSYSFILFGTGCCLTYWDHAGVLISQQYDLTTDAGVKSFIRIISRIRCMSPVDLGQDPTVRPVGSQGLPIFNSTPLLGRAMSVWQATGPDVSLCILKGAWRNALREGESGIYNRSFQDQYLDDCRGRGVTRFLHGGDVAGILTAFLRKEVGTGDPLGAMNHVSTQSRLLHRLTLASCGTGIAKFPVDKPEVFVAAMHDTIRGHEWLWNLPQKVLHRDVSAGNLFISGDPTQGTHGFIADLDYSKAASFAVPQPSNHKGQYSGVSDTAQFMALDCLYALHWENNKLHPEPQVYHDLESFAWITLYCLFSRNLDAIPEEEPAALDLATKTAQNLFGQPTLEQICDARHSVLGNEARWVIFSQRLLFGQSIKELVLDLFDLLSDQVRAIGKTARRGGEPDPKQLLTHEKLCNRLNNTYKDLTGTSIPRKD